MTDPLTKAETKAVVKEAVREWLDDQMASGSKWALRTVMAAILSAWVIFLIHWLGLPK